MNSFKIQYKLNKNIIFGNKEEKFRKKTVEKYKPKFFRNPIDFFKLDLKFLKKLKKFPTNI